MNNFFNKKQSNNKYFKDILTFSRSIYSIKPTYDLFVIILCIISFVFSTLFFFLLLSAMILGKGGMITNEVFSRSWIKWNLCLTTKVPAIVSESQREKLV